MKNMIINAAVCDARDVTEERFAGYDSITINAAILLTGEKFRELSARYPVAVNAASVVDVPDGVSVTSVNGKHEIGPDADGGNVFLIVNGSLTIENGSLEAIKSYYRILVNGSVMMPRSYKGDLVNVTVNGGSTYYPDGAVIIGKNTEIDDLFVARAGSDYYYCPGSVFFLDCGMDTDKLSAKGLRFAAERAVIAESLLAALTDRIDEETEIIRVPDGIRSVDRDIELTHKIIKKYGTKLCVHGDVYIGDADALSSLEYIYASGTVRVSKDLEEAFYDVESVYDELKIIDPEVGYIQDRVTVKVGAVMLKKYPNGVRIEDCAKVTVSEDLSPESIMDKLSISHCAVVYCTKEQEEAVTMISEDVAKISISGADGGSESGMFGGLLGKLKDTKMINAAEYKL